MVQEPDFDGFLMGTPGGKPPTCPELRVHGYTKNTTMSPNPAVAYLPGRPYESGLPLGRYLPPLPAGVARGWLERLVPSAQPGPWIIDPLGASPVSALEAARAGYRVLVVANNPVLAFMLETLASAPSLADFQGALAALASTRRGEERLEVNLEGLYRTPCAACGLEITAEAFLWKRGDTQPYARIYTCPHCHDEGEHPITPADLEHLAALGSDSLSRARALSRVAEREDEHYPAVQEALDTYLPRPLIILQTLINKSEGPGINPAQRKLLQALCLCICDTASTLWPLPGARTRPRQLSIPAQFRESNLWIALEEAAQLWSSHPGPVPLVRWPALPPAEGGICLFAGRVKGLVPLPETLIPAAALAVFPRPNQAFWTLSALWAGWLWGREAALPLHPFLGRRRFDWNWHTTAMHSPLVALEKLLPPGSPLVGLLPELVPGFLAAVLSAASAAGMDLQGLALRSDEEMAQALWRKSPPAAQRPAALAPNAAEKVFSAAVRAQIEERAEPSPYLPLYAAGLSALAREGGLPGPAVQLPGDLLTRLQSLTGRVFADRSQFKRFEGGSQEDERSLWWLNSPLPNASLLPLADRIEMETVRLVQNTPGISRAALDESLCQLFPELLTPSAELITTVLESYAEEIPGGSGKWRLLAQEDPASRRADLEQARDMLRVTGQRMGYTVSGETPVVWTPGSYGQVYFFYIIASSIISRHILAGLPGPSSQVVMVFPGGRARLISYKLRRDPRLAEAVKGLHLLKFRHLRAISERPVLTVDQWDGLLDADPPFFEEAEQMRLL